MPRPAAPLTSTEIDNFARRLKGLLELAQQAITLQAMLGKITSSAPRQVSTPSQAGTTAPSRTARGRRKRQPALATAKVVAVLKGANQTGLSLGEVAKKLGEPNKERVSIALRKLRDDKKAKVVGDRRLARWHAA